ncbi:MAG: phosphoribosyl-AMP cyclohydrolase [Acidimicrobiales bacterium]
MSGNSPPSGLAEFLDDVRFDSNGLVPAIVQDAKTKDVLMLAFMSRESLSRTVKEARTWFYSRRRKELWAKGETSGNRQRVRRVFLDCDGDALIVEVDQQGSGACHTGAWSCFTGRIDLDRGINGKSDSTLERGASEPTG